LLRNDFKKTRERRYAPLEGVEEFYSKNLDHNIVFMLNKTTEKFIIHQQSIPIGNRKHSRDLEIR
jgi:hypothetical protein